MKKTILIYSGGLDSTCLLSQLLKEKQEVICLNFYYGSKHNHLERACAEKICQHYNIPFKKVNLDFINDMFKSDLLQSGGNIPEGHYEADNMSSTVVPFRNGIMLSIATGLAESLQCTSVAIGAHGGDHHIYPDCRPDFTSAMERAMMCGTSSGVEIQAPFLNIDKGDIAKIGFDNGAPLHLTWTCYNPTNGMHCGKCGACVERIEAFKKHDVDDPTSYVDKDFALKELNLKQ